MTKGDPKATASKPAATATKTAGEAKTAERPGAAPTHPEQAATGQQTAASPPPTAEAKRETVDPALRPERAKDSASSLAAAKLAIYAACPYLQKREGKGLNYTFASEADLINLLRPAMVANHVTVAPVGADMIANEEFTTGKGSKLRRVVVKMTYRFTHAPTGQSEDVVMFGEGADIGDKACNKAMTGAMKYALRQWAMVETGDDPDTAPSEQYAKASDEQAAGVKTPMRSSNPQLQDSYEKCKGALGKATTRQQLDAYRTIYRGGRGYEEWMIRDLDQTYLDRIDALAPPPAAKA